jgi:hypothetical protein
VVNCMNTAGSVAYRRTCSDEQDHVRTAAEHDAVVGATWMADGVYAVIDGLHVTG